MAQGNGKQAMETWGWVIRYVVVIALALVLAAVLGHMSLFQKTSLGHKLHASNLAQFLGYGASLAMLWLIGRRATIVIIQQGGKLLLLQQLVLPIVSLIVLALAYPVLQLMVWPFMRGTLGSIVNWLFILLIMACAGWLVAAVFNKSAAVTAYLTGKKPRAQ